VKSPHVITVVLNWNGKQDTLACLASLEQTAYSSHQVVVVDNASVDNSVAAIQQKFPQVHVIANELNLGFSGGNNIGIQWAMRRGADYCFVLNNDTLVDPQAISYLVDTIHADESVGAVGPLIIYMDPKDTIAAFGGEIRWARAEAIQGYNLMPVSAAPATPARTEFLTAAAMLVRKEAVERAGTMPESYFYGMEDAAWCHHIKQAGFRLVADPRARVWHKESAATGRFSPEKMYYTSRNALMFLRREAGEDWRKYLLSYHVKILKQNVRLALEGRWKLLSAFWRGYYAFWQGKQGELVVDPKPDAVSQAIHGRQLPRG
jgi:GT2 family glycosyltransferase